MSGHSKWSTIKHKKAATDAKKGKLFSKLVKEIVVSAKLGGADIGSNPRLRMVVSKAKEASMPAKNIESAIQKGIGNKEGSQYEEMTYEGYGPGGVAILVDCLTDNKNRTVSDVRFAFGKRGGNLGESGSVAWQFEKKGIAHIEKKNILEEELLEKALELGAEDVSSDDAEVYTVKIIPETFEEVIAGFKKMEIAVAHSELTMYPKNFIKIDTETSERISKLVEHLEDLDDVQNVYSNESV